MANNSNSNNGHHIRYAVVRLGWIAQETVLPAFAQASNSQLTALVSDDPTKQEELGKKYGVKTYSYGQYEECLNSGDIDAVYIALPNHLHLEYTQRAADKGIHILCEKPMAVTEEECEHMMRAAKENNVKLMIAYRLHFDKANLQAIETIKSGKIGEPRIFNSVFSQQVAEDNVRMEDISIGGGTVYDMGVYCINAVRYLFQDEPTEIIAVSANNGEKRFEKIEEMTSVIMRFPGERLATFTSSFGAASVSSYQVVGTKGDLRMDSAYSYQGELKQQITINQETQEESFSAGDQFAAEIIYFSDCVLNNKEPEPSGEEGLADVRIIRAIYESAQTGKPVKLGTFKRQLRPGAEQIIERPANEQQPELVHAADPSGKS
ncbi:glucose-fructose oxidoreductase [Dulcicalothrix desertica PCC 7102]|uniref:Glucose-fructose oxidoreductase n=1 Tax=Dulcicalothrix desertica PCC 7102 TaxID=232991 RepID=A0A3S1ARR6_9CYAN|nr:Gfo/Idh/MocA family oxidoreductase [Dulcicalothrix desertica]RUS98004.1 glucose-fructose oxidoreductase [Dulcicalothrix desertica PCC 7102]TWH54493.1 glucose-fructose oxidoreductase [Dulcicalothrix desertica PCC 7102]